VAAAVLKSLVFEPPGSARRVRSRAPEATIALAFAATRELLPLSVRTRPGRASKRTRRARPRHDFHGEDGVELGVEADTQPSIRVTAQAVRLPSGFR
jgi:hypothetical protein